MGLLMIRDDAIWTKHIQGADIVDRILSLEAHSSIVLEVDGRNLVFEKMSDGRDGRPTPGLRAHASSRLEWRKFQERRGEIVTVHLPDGGTDRSYLASLGSLFTEWDSAEDSAAYDGL